MAMPYAADIAAASRFRARDMRHAMRARAMRARMRAQRGCALFTRDYARLRDAMAIIFADYFIARQRMPLGLRHIADGAC